MNVGTGRRGVGIVLSAAVLVVAAAGIASATIPALGGAINGCYDASTGALRVIDYPSQHCPHGEKFLRWSQTGPRGLPGPQGTQGPPGLSGYEQKSHQVFVNAGAFITVSAFCSPGKKVLGGAFDIETPAFVKVFASEPTDGAGNAVTDRWSAIVQNEDSAARQVTVTAICAFVQ